MKSYLVGYVRKSYKGNSIELSIQKEAFDDAETYISQSGDEYVKLTMGLEKLKMLINGDKEVTAILSTMEEF